MRRILPWLYDELLAQTFFEKWRLEPLGDRDSEYSTFAAKMEEAMGTSPEWRQLIQTLDRMAGKDGKTERASSFTFRQLVAVAPKPAEQREAHPDQESTRTTNVFNGPTATTAALDAGAPGEGAPKENPQPSKPANSDSIDKGNLDKLTEAAQPEKSECSPEPGTRTTSAPDERPNAECADTIIRPRPKDPRGDMRWWIQFSKRNAGRQDAL